LGILLSLIPLAQHHFSAKAMRTALNLLYRPTASYVIFLWFIYVLFEFYLIAPLISRAYNPIIILFLTAAIGLSLIHVSNNLFAIHLFSRHFIFLLLGIIAVLALLFLLVLGFVIAIQRNMRAKITSEIIPQLEDVKEAIQLSNRDAAFMENIRQIVDDNLTNPELNVEFLSSALQLDRTQVFRRLKTITGKGPLDYIRERRLIRADKLLNSTDMTVRQVAYELRFASPGYFSKYYKQYFGHLPSKR
jgi:AraC-like DNA-binding protein